MLLITVRYKFLSAKDFHEIQLPGPYTTVADLKSEILNAKFKAKKHNNNNTGEKNDNNRGQYSSIWNGCCLGTDHDLLIIDSKTNTPYSNDSDLIYDQSAVLLRRVPGDRRRRLLDTEPIDLRPQQQETDSDSGEGDSLVTDENVTSREEEIDIHDFGEDLFDIQQKKKRAADEEDMKIKELVDTPALGMWFPAAPIQSRKRNLPYSSLSSLPPPPDYYVCHRCGIKGHFIQDCPTNGDPEFDHRKRMRPTVTLNPAAENEFNNLMEGISSISSDKTSSSSETASTSSSNKSYLGGVVPAELHCPLCKSVMRDAVFAKRCCFKSFCDGCIRDHVNKSTTTCACGAANVDAKVDDFVPNVTVRKLIKSILLQMSSISSCSSSSTSVGSSDCSTVITM